ncbi:MAG: SpoIIE family protein phosphatase, partial [Planctomycetes bacterium]|nr:SpoIIE family protein phosphatase [Planctomycetota bacterium]
MSEEQKEKILVVYDSQTIRETISVIGIENAYNVIELDDPALLTETIEDELPDLVILCAMTKKSTAYESCNIIKSSMSANFMPVIIYALNASEDSVETAFQASADDIVRVTIKSDELLYRIRSLLRIRDLVRTSQQRTANMARASAEAADMMLQLEEADRRIREQNEELERMVLELKERDTRIQAQQAEIGRHLETLQQEMELAASLQLNLLPSVYPEAGDLALYDRYIPAAELCGDYYDYVAMPDGKFVVTIADVTGHGVAPALVSVQVRTMARTAILAGKSPAEVLHELNVFMIDMFKQDFLLTMVCLSYDPESHI